MWGKVASPEPSPWGKGKGPASPPLWDLWWSPVLLLRPRPPCGAVVCGCCCCFLESCVGCSKVCTFYYVFVSMESMLFRMYPELDSIDLPWYSIDLCIFLAQDRLFISYVILFSFLSILIAFNWVSLLPNAFIDLSLIFNSFHCFLMICCSAAAVLLRCCYSEWLHSFLTC